MNAATSVHVNLRNLPAFSPVAAKLMGLLRREQVNFREAADLIKTDAGLTAEVLRLANSSLTGMRFPSPSLLHALTILGVKQIGSMVTTLCVGKLLKPVSKLPLTRQLWRHNLATALLARERAEDHGIDPEDGYLYGLLAGIGRLALLISDPAGYTHLAERAEREGLSLDVLESEFFGFDNRDAGRWLAGRWQLPSELLKIFSPQSGMNATRLVLEASTKADCLGFGVIAGATIEPDDAATFDIIQKVNQIEQELGV